MGVGFSWRNLAPKNVMQAVGNDDASAIYSNLCLKNFSEKVNVFLRRLFPDGWQFEPASKQDGLVFVGRHRGLLDGVSTFSGRSLCLSVSTNLFKTTFFLWSTTRIVKKRLGFCNKLKEQEGTFSFRDEEWWGKFASRLVFQFRSKFF